MVPIINGDSDPILKKAMLSLENCRLLACRMLRKDKEHQEEWNHIIRFCKEAGITGSVLR